MVVPLLLRLPVLWFLLQEFSGFFVLYTFWSGGWSQSFPPSLFILCPAKCISSTLIPAEVEQPGWLPGTLALQNFLLGFALLKWIMSSRHQGRPYPSRQALVGDFPGLLLLQSVTKFWSKGLSWPSVTPRSQISS